MTDPKKKPLTDKERQAFIDSLPPDQRNPDPKATFDKLIERASTTPIPKGSGQSADDEDYTDTQTHLHKTEDTSARRSDTSHQSNASSDSKNPQ
jgi:hypothetical protein